MNEPSPKSPGRQRGRFTLGLRGLMLLILVVGAPMGWKARKAHLQRRAVARIERLRGSVRYDWQPGGFPIVPPGGGGPKGPAWFRRMVGDEYFQDVVGVTLPDLQRTPLRAYPSPDDPREGLVWKAFQEAMRQDEEADKALQADELASLDGLDRIETLNLWGPTLHSEGLARLGRLSSLKEFVSQAPLTDEALAQVAKLTALENLTIELKLADASALAFLERLPRLKSLMISDGSTRAGMNFGLVLQDPARRTDRLTDQHLARLGRLGHLTSLSLNGSEIDDAGLAHLKGLGQLENLFLSETPRITDAGLIHLGGFKSLKALDLGMAAEITDAGLAHLAGLEGLEWLDLKSASKITDAGIDSLLGMRKLQVLELNAISLTDAGLNRLRSLPKLYSLNLTGATIRGEVLDGLQAAIPGLGLKATRRKPGEPPSDPAALPVLPNRSPFETKSPPDVLKP